MNWITRFINNLFAPNYYVANVTQDHPTFSIPGPPITDEILADMLKAWSSITEPPDIEDWFQSVGHWLTQVHDGDVYQRWVLRLALAIQQRVPELPLEVCALVIQTRVHQAMKGAHV